MSISLCESCRLVRIVVTPKGSRFLLCQHSAEDAHFAKYPPQPVVRCRAHQIARDEPQDDKAVDN